MYICYMKREIYMLYEKRGIYAIKREVYMQYEKRCLYAI